MSKDYTPTGLQSYRILQPFLNESIRISTIAWLENKGSFKDSFVSKIKKASVEMKGLVLKYKVEPKMKKGACMLNIQDPFLAKSTATVILQVLKEKKYKTQDVAQPRRNPNPNPPEHPLIPDDNPRAAANLSPRKMAFPEISLEEYERRLKKAFRSNPETTDGLIAALGLGCSSIIEELNYIACGFYMTDLTDKGWYDGMPVQYYWEDLVRCIPCTRCQHHLHQHLRS